VRFCREFFVDVEPVLYDKCYSIEGERTPECRRLNISTRLVKTDEETVKTCPKCKTPIPNCSKFCSHCGSTLKRRVAPVVLMGCFGLILLMGVFALILQIVFRTVPASTSVTASGGPSSRVPVPERSSDPAVCLELLSKHGSVDEYSTTITGTIKNDCGRRFRYVQVTFKLFDASGDVVGTALANQNDLEFGETWKFKAHAFTACRRFSNGTVTAF
jgi:Double zinc ribbon